MLVSSAGFVLLVYGRKMARPPHLLTGIVLLVLPFLVPGAALMLAIAAVLGVVLWLAVRYGW